MSANKGGTGDFSSILQEFPVNIISQNSYNREMHNHVEFEIFHLKKGSVIFAFEGHETEVKEGDVIFIDSFVRHFVRKKHVDDDFECDEVLFDASALGQTEDPCRLFLSSVKVQRFLQLPDELKKKISLAAEDKNFSYGREILLKSVLFEIFSHIIRTGQYEVISPQGLQYGFIKKRSISAIDNAVVYIRKNYKDNISLDSILNLTNYSKSHFIRLFKESTGMNLSEYVNKYRIEKACLDLLYTNKNITEIAITNGFNNIQYFSRTFKGYMNCTPKQYQKKGQHITLPV